MHIFCLYTNNKYMKRKYVSFFIVFLFCFLSCFSLTGCSSGVVGIYIEEAPTKCVYKLNEKIVLKGAKIKGINADGTTRKIRANNNNIENKVDMSTKGEKTVIINVDNNRTSFTIYIPHYVLTPQDDLKQIISQANNGEIIYLTKGVYENSEQNLQKYKDVIVNKSLIFIGDKEETVFSGNFIVGNNNLQETLDLNKVEFYNINFSLKNTSNNGLITYPKPYYNTIVCAIDANDTKGLYVKNCEFEGYSYAIKMNNAEYLSVIKNRFKDIKISALKTQTSTKNTTVYKNVFMDICENTLYLNENGQQNYMAAIDFAFNSEQNSGTIIANNTFARIGSKTSDFVAVNEQSKQENINQNIKLNKLSYVNNTAIIILRSSNKSNLKTRGIILSNNSYGTTLNNIIFGTKEDDFLNESAVIINNN